MSAKSIFKPSGMTREEERAFAQIQLAADPEGAATRHAELVNARVEADAARLAADKSIIDAAAAVAKAEQRKKDLIAEALQESARITAAAVTERTVILADARAEVERIAAEAQAAAKGIATEQAQRQTNLDALDTALAEDRRALDAQGKDLRARESALAIDKAALAQKVVNLAAALKAAS